MREVRCINRVRKTLLFRTGSGLYGNHIFSVYPLRPRSPELDFRSESPSIRRYTEKGSFPYPSLAARLADLKSISICSDAAVIRRGMAKGSFWYYQLVSPSASSSSAPHGGVKGPRTLDRGGYTPTRSGNRKNWMMAAPVRTKTPPATIGSVSVSPRIGMASDTAITGTRRLSGVTRFTGYSLRR